MNIVFLLFFVSSGPPLSVLLLTFFSSFIYPYVILMKNKTRRAHSYDLGLLVENFLDYQNDVSLFLRCLISFFPLFIQVSQVVVPFTIYLFCGRFSHGTGTLFTLWANQAHSKPTITVPHNQGHSCDMHWRETPLLL